MVDRKPLFFVLFAALTLSACDITPLENAIDSFRVVIDPLPIETEASFELIDAQSGELISEEVEIVITPPDDGQIIDYLSDPLQSVRVEDGRFIFGYNGAVPTRENPVSFQIQISSPNYETSEFTVILSDSINTGEIALIHKTNQPSYIFTSAQTVSLPTSGIDEPISFEMNGGEAFLQIDSGSVIRNSEGEILSGDVEIKAKLINFTDFEEEQNLLAPGGLAELDGEYYTPLAEILIEIDDSRATKQQFAKVSDSLGTTYKVFFIVDGWGGGTSLEVEDPLNYVLAYQAIDQTLRTFSVKEIRNYSYDEEKDLHKMTFIFEEPSDLGPSKSYVVFIKEDEECFLSSIQVTPNNFKADAELFKRDIDYQLKHKQNIYIDNGQILRKRNTIKSGLVYYSYAFAISPGTYSIKLDGIYSDLFQACRDGGNSVYLESGLPEVTMNVQTNCINPDEKLRIKNIPLTWMFYKKGAFSELNGYWHDARLTFDYDAESMALTGGTFEMKNVDISTSPEYSFYLVAGNNKFQRTIQIESLTQTYTETFDSELCQ